MDQTTTDKSLEQKTIEIYCDGGVMPKGDKIGAWAYLILDPNSKEEKVLEEKSQGEIDTTNNKMELTAAIKALNRIKELENKYKFTHVKIYTDSQYLQMGMMVWIKTWKKTKWKTKFRDKPVKNRELWEELDSFTSSWNIKYFWVKGHAYNDYNNRVDLLCQEEIRKTITAYQEKK
jgi:ribonuclease HI